MGEKILRNCKSLRIAVVVVYVLMSSVFVNGNVWAATSQESSVTHRLLTEERISEGTMLRSYELGVNGQFTTARVMEVDLKNPFVEIRAISPEGGFNDKQTVKQMAEQSGAVAAVNADFFRLDRAAAPFGLHVEEGQLLSSPAHLGNWLGFGIDSNKLAAIDNWTFSGKVILGDNSYELFGYNKPEHFPWSGNSHTNRINMYDKHWGEEVPAKFFDEPMSKLIVENDRIVGWGDPNQSVKIPNNGYVLAANGNGAAFLEQYAVVGEPIAIDYTLTPDIDLMTAVGGHALLVENGQPVRPLKVNIAGKSVRSAVGTDALGETVYFISADASKSLTGVTLEELSLFISQLGIYKAVNLDGGGSTTVVAQKLGKFEHEIVNPLVYGVQRKLPNAIGIFNTAPKSDPDTIFIHGAPGVLLGSETTYSLSGYDKHYHPLKIEASDANVIWQVSDAERAEVANGVLKGKKPGEVSLQAAYLGAQVQQTVKIYGKEDIENIKIIPERIALLPGQKIALQTEVTMKDGRKLLSGAETVEWRANLGHVENNVFYAGEQEGTGTLTAVIDGIVTEIPVYIGGEREAFFTFRDFQTVSFRAHPETLQGSFEMQNDPQFIYRGTNSGKLTYDFRTDHLPEWTAQPGDDVRIAYGQLGSGQIAMGSDTLGVSAYVYGDGSGYWLRAEVLDAKGALHYVDLAEQVDWHGWKRVQGQIDQQYPQPYVLRSIYLVRHADRVSDSAPLTGQIYIDHVEAIKAVTDKSALAAQLLRLEINGVEFENVTERIARVNHEYPALNMRMIGYAWQLALAEKETAKVRIDEPEDAGDSVYQLGRWNPKENQWDLLPAMRDADNKQLVFSLTHTGNANDIYQLFLTPRSMMGFVDLQNHWSKMYLQDLAASGIFQGYTDGTIRPDQSVTRAEFVVLLERVFGSDLATANSVAGQGAAIPPEERTMFQDEIPVWAQDAVAVADRLQIVRGYEDGTFRPQQKINRTEMAVMIGRTLEILSSSTPSEDNGEGQTNQQEQADRQEQAGQFLDADQIPDWGKAHVSDMHQKGLITGHEGFFRPNANATRAETAVIFWRYLNEM